MRRAAKVDANTTETVAYLRSKGWHVTPTHTLGQGKPDFIASKRMGGRPWMAWVELKVPGGKLTTDEQEFAEEFLGPLVVCYGPEDCERALKQEWQGLELDHR